MERYSGVFTALVTPFRDGKVDFGCLERLVQRQIDAKIDGVVPCGTTGEAPTLSHDEHREVVRAVVKAAGGKLRVIAGAGSNNTQTALQFAREAADAGADGLLCVSPYYNRPSQAGLFAHFSAIAKETRLPIMLYNIPGRCGVEISIETIRRLAETHDNIRHVKHATGGVVDAAALLEACDVTVLSGDDPLTLPLMAIGATGVVSVASNLVPEAVKRLTDAAQRGDLPAATLAHRALFPLARVLLSLDSNPVPLKAAMALRGLCNEDVRLPLTPLNAEQREKLSAALRAAESLR